MLKNKKKKFDEIFRSLFNFPNESIVESDVIILDSEVEKRLSDLKIDIDTESQKVYQDILNYAWSKDASSFEGTQITIHKLRAHLYEAEMLIREIKNKEESKNE